MSVYCEGLLEMTSELTEQVSTAQTMAKLAHDIRQPLSGIENITYCLEMMSADPDPKAVAQLERMRQFIDQANWILEDAVQATMPIDARIATHPLSQMVRDYAADLAFRTDRDVRFQAEGPDVAARMDAGMTEAMLDWIIEFGREVAQADDPVSMYVRHEFDEVSVTVNFKPGVSEAKSLALLIDPVQRMGSLRARAAAQNGFVRAVEAPSGLLSIKLGFPRV